MEIKYNNVEMAHYEEFINWASKIISMGFLIPIIFGIVPGIFGYLLYQNPSSIILISILTISSIFELVMLSFFGYCVYMILKLSSRKFRVFREKVVLIHLPESDNTSIYKIKTDSGKETLMISANKDVCNTGDFTDVICSVKGKPLFCINCIDYPGDIEC